ncbi:MAG: SMI1/KNR4 family protein [Maricaulaceae bacterium]
MLSLVQYARPARAEDIKKLEDLVGHSLPDDYLNFLRTINGGWYNQISSSFYCEEHGHHHDINKLLHMSSSIDDCTDDRFRKNFLYNTVFFETEEARNIFHIPDHFIVIATCEHALYYLDSKSGEVWYWYDEFGPEIESTQHFLENAKTISPSFTEFQSKIIIRKF